MCHNIRAINKLVDQGLMTPRKSSLLSIAPSLVFALRTHALCGAELLTAHKTRRVGYDTARDVQTPHNTHLAPDLPCLFARSAGGCGTGCCHDVHKHGRRGSPGSWKHPNLPWLFDSHRCHGERTNLISSSIRVRGLSSAFVSANCFSRTAMRLSRSIASGDAALLCGLLSTVEAGPRLIKTADVGLIG